MEGRLAAIERLYKMYFNTDQDAEDFGEEFFFAVGETLSGKPLEELVLKKLVVRREVSP